jgi:gliding motility-associated-like protein
VIATTANDGNTYQVDILSTVTGCIYNSPVITVRVLGTLDINLTATAACEGSPFTITAASTPTVIAPTYTWTFNNTVTGNNSATHTDTRGGTYTANASIFIGTTPACTDQESIQILVSPITAGKMNDRAIICDEDANQDPATSQVTLRPGPGFSTFNWFKDGVALSPAQGGNDSIFVARDRGLYTVDLVNVFGCPSSDQTRVDSECAPKITGPNAFRPGGVNSDFFLYTFFIADTDFSVFIFNRWGEMVYQSTERDFRWNGGYNNNSGQPLPPGTYAYVVKFKSAYQNQGSIQEKRGGVVLLR